jgi:hypothetical protein
MISFPKAFVVAALIRSCLFAQPTSEAHFAAEVRSAVALLSSRPQLSEWKASHAEERIDPAHYETVKDPYEVDFARQNQWCATSVATVSAGVIRAASFYVPEATGGTLPQLPAKQDSALTGYCRLREVWYEAHGGNSVAAITKELAAAWGAPHESSHRERARDLSIRGAGLWQDVMTWRRGSVTVWLAWTDWDKGDGVGSRTIAWLSRDRTSDLDLTSIGFDTTAPALRIANLGPALTANITPSANYARPDSGVAVGRLSQWLQASNSLPAERRAAALLVADSFVPFVMASEDKPDPLAVLGVKYEPGCTQDNQVYAHNFRDQASALDPRGPVGALAALARLQSPCTLKGTGPWPDQVIDQGQRILRQFAPGPWSPWVHFAIARAHDVKLSFSIPPGEADIGVIHYLSASQSQDERTAAIDAFTQFIRDEPDSAEAVFAWQEAWRLLAGLSPSPTRFGCSCE